MKKLILIVSVLLFSSSVAIATPVVTGGTVTTSTLWIGSLPNPNINDDFIVGPYNYGETFTSTSYLEDVILLENYAVITFPGNSMPSINNVTLTNTGNTLDMNLKYRKFGLTDTFQSSFAFGETLSTTIDDLYVDPTTGCSTFIPRVDSLLGASGIYSLSGGLLEPGPVLLNGGILQNLSSTITLSASGGNLLIEDITLLPKPLIQDTLNFSALDVYSSEVNSVPEPTTFALVGICLAGIVGYGIRRRLQRK